ncbi:Structural maintenance of chromosomes protein 1 [Irineochytrium annulatum]|nr:Structural maintenance of chromosomes protein 1 [Irineochytrium annulatum]
MRKGRLLHLEVENFKSYKGHQQIGPFDNFTSVIGPNGSGKSNLMDAISFVLGVKSTHLRSTQLKDLIYRSEKATSNSDGEDEDGDGEEEERGAGRKDGEREPRTAQVTAVYRNSQKNIVRFSRTILASGTSEYKINGKSVAYARYNSALEEENILVKARNFLVFQGDVEAVASQSPKDLTRLIEQISGSLELKPEYERLKALQERATENSTFNFNKKRGIAAEMKQFREQKEEAERFEKLIRDKNKQTMTYLLWKLYHCERTVKKIEADIEEINEGSAEAVEELARLEGEVKDARKSMGKASKECIKLEKKLKEKREDVEDRDPQLVNLEEQIKHKTKKITQSREKLKKMKEDLKAQKKTIDELEICLKEVTGDLRKYTDSVKKRSARGKTQVSEKDLKEYQKMQAFFPAYGSNLNRKEDITAKTLLDRQKLATLKRDINTEKENKLRKKESLTSALSKVSRLQEELAAIEERKEKKTESVATLEASLDKARGEYDAVDAERRKMRQQEQQKNEQLAEVQNKLLQARADMSENERGERNRETLESLKSIFPGVYGRLSDLCKPTQRKYDLAVSTIIGRNMDSIVVDNDRTGMDCIQHLREQRSGLATFLPLDTISFKPINEKYRNLVRGAKLAVDVISVEPKYERALHFACGSSLVCDTLEIAKEVCWGRGQEVKAVTLDGTVLHKTGLMTGGSTNASARDARRWEEKEIENLKRVRQTLLDDLNEIAKAKRKLATDDQMRSEIQTLEKKKNTEFEDLNATKRKAISLQKELADVNKTITSLNKDLKSMSTQLESKEFDAEELETVLRAEEDKAFESFCKKVKVADIREFEEGQGQFEREVEQKKLEFQANIDKFENQLNFERNQFNDLSDRVAKIEASVTTEEGQLASLNDEKAAHAEETEQLKSEVAELEQSLAEITGSLDEKKAAFESAKKALAKVQKDMEGKSKSISGKG